MFSWSCMHDIMSTAGHLVQTRLCFSRIEGVSADNGCGFVGRAEGQLWRKPRIVLIGAAVRGAGSSS